ncbi:hypothetical protein G6F68_019018 [Rhizopus microsporus]|nr:hypothetical protein G6F68_019018 [Rhizopus microsporus]
MMNVLTGIYVPTAGAVEFSGKSLVGLAPADIAAAGIARTFQNVQLFGEMTALENVMFGPVHTRGQDRGEARKLAEGLLDKVGLGERMHHYPAELSGGQQQRVAIARALAIKPKLML